MKREIIEEVILESAPRLAYFRRGAQMTAELTREVALDLLSRLREHYDFTLDLQLFAQTEDRVVVKAILNVTYQNRIIQTAELGEALLTNDHTYEYAFRLASTRAIKRALEAQVGDLNVLMIGLARLFEIAKRPPRSLPPQAAQLVRALGAGEISAEELKARMKLLVQNTQSTKPHQTSDNNEAASNNA